MAIQAIQSFKALPTKKKVAIGVGAAAVVGATIAAGVAGRKDVPEGTKAVSKVFKSIGNGYKKGFNFAKAGVLSGVDKVKGLFHKEGTKVAETADGFANGRRPIQM